MDFVPFEIAKKLKEKGFGIPTSSIFAMYNELGGYCPQTTNSTTNTFRSACASFSICGVCRHWNTNL